MINQLDRYDNFYGKMEKLRKIFRFDIRYRCRRMHEILKKLKIKDKGISVLDFGFGSGDMLLSYDKSCKVYGADVSHTAVGNAYDNHDFRLYRHADFMAVPEFHPEKMFGQKFDIVISSHSIEHVYNDDILLKELKKRLKDDGHLVLFVPIEEPDYISFHLRNYSLQSIQEKVLNAGYEIEFCEGSMYINGHIWKLLTIPSRRNWPILGKVVDAIRLFTLSLIPFKLVKLFDLILEKLGFGPRQAVIIAKKRSELS